MKNKIIVTDKKHLQDLIKEEINLHGHECDLNHLDVSGVTEMNSIFSSSSFNGDISQWDVGEVTNMDFMFYYSHFTGDISQWNISRVRTMAYMFKAAKFNSDISNWDVSRVTNMTEVFSLSLFNGDISSWKPYKLQAKDYMFDGCPAIKPDWYNAENIANAIQAYEEQSKLQQRLIIKPVTKVKMKI